MRQANWLLCLALLAVAGCDGRAEPEAEAPGANPAAQPPETVPQRYRDRHEQLMKRTQRGNVGLLLLGDSITDNWKYYRDLWKDRFGAYRPANYGVSADVTQGVLWRIEQGELEGISPDVVVLMIGTNNLKSGPVRMSPAQTAGGVAAVVDRVLKELPDTHIALMSILPRQHDQYDWIDAAVREANERLERIAAQRDRVTWVDIHDEFIAADGTLREKLYTPDMLHPGEQGYVVWADALKPVLAEHMEPAPAGAE